MLLILIWFSYFVMISNIASSWLVTWRGITYLPVEIKIISVNNSFNFSATCCLSLICLQSFIKMISLWSALVLLEINSFTIFQKCIVFMGPFLHFGLKCSLITCCLSLTHRFLWIFHAIQSKVLLLLLYLFLNFNLCIIALLRFLLLNAAWFPLMSICLMGACTAKVSLSVMIKVLYAVLVSRLPLCKAWLWDAKFLIKFSLFSYLTGSWRVYRCTSLLW